MMKRIGYGVVANIIASHAIARGSIPRVGIVLLFTPSLQQLQWCIGRQNEHGGDGHSAVDANIDINRSTRIHIWRGHTWK